MTLDGTCLCEERLRLARLALMATGYFTDAEVGPDIAPRISELWSTRSDECETIRKAFMVLTRTSDAEVELLARRLVAADARTVQPWLVQDR